jgi:lactate permease
MGCTGQLLLGQVNQTLCAFVPCCIALVVSLLLGKTKWYNTPWKIENSKIMDEKFAASASEDYPQDMSLMQAFMPYFVLTGITLFVLLIAPVKAFLGQVSIGFDFPEMRTGYNYIVPAVKRFSSYTPFTHASMFLLLASVIGLVFFRRHNWISKEGSKVILMKSIEKTVPSGIAVIGFIVMSRIMGGTGMTVVLAEGIAGVFGPAYTWLAAVIGMLGAFMTSSKISLITSVKLIWRF